LQLAPSKDKMYIEEIKNWTVKVSLDKNIYREYDGINAELAVEDIVGDMTLLEGVVMFPISQTVEKTSFIARIQLVEGKNNWDYLTCLSNEKAFTCFMEQQKFGAGVRVELI